MSDYAPNAIVRTLIGKYLPYRQMELAERGGAGPISRKITNDDVVSEMERFRYTRLDAISKTPRGKRNWAVILVLDPSGKYTNHSPDLRMLVESTEAEPAARSGRLNELIIIACTEFFGKKNMTDVIRALQRKQTKTADAEGEAPLYNAYPFHTFSFVVPEHKSVPPHEIMAEDEVQLLLKKLRLARAALPLILSCDPPIVWCGGREGQVVRVTRDSRTARTAIMYRRIVHALYENV
jgi:DNA-directed RNA polymerase subunit H